MPSPDESSPNFDFLQSDAASHDEPAWQPPSDSAIDVVDAVPNASEASEPAAPELPAEPLEASAPKKKAKAVGDVEPAPTAAPASADAAQPKASVDDDQVESAAAKSRTKTGSAKKRPAKKPSSKAPAKDGQPLTISGPAAVALLSYALTMTLVALYFVMFSEKNQLESLPDRQPLKPNEFRFVPETASVGDNHVLKLGDSVRFGHIRVEPLRVTRGNIELEHYTGRNDLKAPKAGEDVIKLWFRFTNESTDQRIAPLDRHLVYDRRMADDSFDVLSDQYVVPADKQGTDDTNVVIYDLSPDGEWNLVGQDLSQLEPGQSIETYLAAGPEELDQLTGDAVWRVLFRKGFNNATGHGVLTLIDVEFDASAATSES